MLGVTINDLLLAICVIFGVIVCCALGCYTYISSRRLATTDIMARCMERFATRVAVRDFDGEEGGREEV